MSDYIISCCSTADLSKEHFQARDIKYVCFHYILNGEDYSDDLGQSIPFEEFYKKMAEGADTKTSQVNVAEYIDYYNNSRIQAKTKWMPPSKFREASMMES